MNSDQNQDAIASVRIASLENALRAVLLFHGATVWGPEQRDGWHRLIGKEESANTRTLCDCVRSALATGTVL